MSIRDDGEHMFVSSCLLLPILAFFTNCIHIFSRLCLFKERIPTHAIVDVLVIIEENWFTHVSDACDLSSDFESYSQTNSCKRFYSSLMKVFELRERNFLLSKIHFLCRIRDICHQNVFTFLVAHLS